MPTTPPIRLLAPLASLLVLVISGAVPAAAAAHVLSNAPQYESTVQSAPAHVHVTLIGGTKDVRISVDPGHVVVVDAPGGEPLVQIDAAGVSINRHSPTSYGIRPAAVGQTPVVDLRHPQWLMVDPGGRSITYHDPRAAWPSSHRPPGTSPWRSGRQRVTAWTLPMRVDGHAGAVHGTLYYTGGNAPWATLAELVLVLALCGLVVRALVRSSRRRVGSRTCPPARDSASLPL